MALLVMFASCKLLEWLKPCHLSQMTSSQMQSAVYSCNRFFLRAFLICLVAIMVQACDTLIW